MITGQRSTLVDEDISLGPDLRPAREQGHGRTGQLLLYLTLRELRSQYKRTFLGWAWSLLNPLLSAAVFSLVFGAFFKLANPVGDPSGIRQFSLFLLCGLIPWNLFSNTLNRSMTVLMSNAGLIQKVQFRRSTLVIATGISAFVSFLIEIAITIALIAIFGSWRVIEYVVPVLPVFAALGVFSIGLGLLLSVVNVVFRDMQHIMTLVLLAWFYLTPVVYSVSIVPKSWKLFGSDVPARTMVDWNPMTKFIGAVRHCLYDFRVPSLHEYGVCVLVAALSIALGLYVFDRREVRFAEQL